MGPTESKLVIAAHGSHSSKSDDCIRIFSEEAVTFGYQVLSFDFPKHGDRINEPEPCMVQECVKELKEILTYAKSIADKIYLFACSMGAYFSLLAYKDDEIEHALFLSPVTDMERIIHNIMAQFNVTEERFRKEKTIENPVETLYWDYYRYIRENPVAYWEHPTSILYGEHDTMCEYEYVFGFAKRFHCDFTVQAGGEHWFHTPEELGDYRSWIREKLRCIK